MSAMTGVTWRTSMYSNGNGMCVEVADLPAGGRLLRDTKDHGCGPVLRFADAEWRAFVASIKGGQFD